MKTFKSFAENKELQKNTFVLSDSGYDFDYNTLIEKLITFGGKSYPKFNNIVIMTGGGASVKGSVRNKLVDRNGLVYDVDDLKDLAPNLYQIRRYLEKELNMELRDIKEVREKIKKSNPIHLDALHDAVKELKLPNKKLQTLYTSIVTADDNKKPNIIFDVTLKTYTKFRNIVFEAVNKLGYNRKNVHLVWVVQDFDVAVKLNKERGKQGDREVPYDVLLDAHAGASRTIFQLVNSGSELRKLIDGDVVFVFNNVNVDTKEVKSGNISKSWFNKKKDETEGSYIKDANYVYIKRRGKEFKGMEDISDDIVKKIRSYIPDPEKIWKK